MTREEKKLEFYDLVKENIADYLPQEKIENVSITQVLKNNDTELTAVVINSKNGAAVPSIYINHMAEKYADGANPHELLEKIAKIYRDNCGIKFNVEEISDFEKVKHCITTKLVNTKLNQKLLSTTPHVEVGDMAVILRLQLDESKFPAGNGSITVNDNILQLWGTTFENVMPYAVENDINYKQPILRTWEEIFKNRNLLTKTDEEAAFLPDARVEELEMYILTTTGNMDGANLMCHPELMEEIATFLDGDYIVIPSSIHECIIVPCEKGMDLEDFREIMADVNEKSLSPEEVLNDHPFLYDREEKQLYYEKDGEKCIVDLTAFGLAHAKERQKELEREPEKEGIGAKLKAGQEKAKTENTGKDVPRQKEKTL